MCVISRINLNPSADSKKYTESGRYGQKHPVETPQLIADSLAELDELIETFPSSKKEGWELAKKNCAPELVDSKHKLMFLRCDTFHVDLAAERLVKYWDKRIELYGDDKAFLPLSIAGNCKDDEGALLSGVIRLIPGAKDDEGRAILFSQGSRCDSSKYERKEMVRAVWYLLHAALEKDATVQQKGIVCVTYQKGAKMSQIDLNLLQLVAENVMGVIPVRMAGFHVTHPASFFSLIFPFISMLAGPRLKKRIKSHSGSHEKVLSKLEKYGLDRKFLPTELGGDLELNHVKWLEARKSAGV